MELKRVTLVCGHYGSGKTGIAVELARALKKRYANVAAADLDIVNPYFRLKDRAEELRREGIRVIASEYASSGLDLPALPQELYSITEDRALRAVIDLGGDDRGALAMGRWRDALIAENDYEMLCVVNRYRPLTADAASTVAILREIEIASGMRCTHIVNNSNLGAETTAETVLSGMEYAREVSARSGLPLKMTCAPRTIAEQLEDRVENLFPLDIAKAFFSA